MEVGGVPTDVLLQRPWLDVNIGGCQLLAKSWFGDTAYHILLTDMSCVWEERMDSAAIQNRAQELNKRLRAPVRAFFSHLSDVVRPCLSGSCEEAVSKAQVSLMRQEDGNISMKLKSELAGLPFYWEFHCTPAPITMVCVQLLRPLLAMSRLLQRQVEQLGGLLLRKDAEIQDYRENGATLSRERLQTEAFEEQSYREDFMSKALPLLRSERDTLGFGGDLQHLYAAVVAHGNAQKRRLSEEERSATEEPSLGDPSVDGEPAEDDREQTENRARMAARPTVKQSVTVTSDPTERLPSKTKKKKVGLFR